MRSISKYFLAGAFLAGLGASPAAAAISTFDLVFSGPSGFSATGSVTIDTALLSNGSCGFGQGCGFNDFAAQVTVGSSTFNFGPNTEFLFEAIVADGVPVELNLSTPTNPSNEDPNDSASLWLAGNAFAVSGVIDEFEFTLQGTYAVATGGGQGPDPTGVPEPGTLALFGAGLVGVALTRRKRARVA
jgi:hypothetical protein